MIRYLPAKHDRLTGSLSPWWHPLRTSGPRSKWAPPSFHPERGARWLAPLPADTVMFDVDIVAFRAVNDTHGVPIGDVVRARQIRDGAVRPATPVSLPPPT